MGEGGLREGMGSSSLSTKLQPPAHQKYVLFIHSSKYCRIQMKCLLLK